MVGKVSRMFFWVLNPLRHVLMQSSLSFKKGCVYFMYFPGVVASINQSIKFMEFQKTTVPPSEAGRGTIAPKLSRYIVEHPCQTTGNPRGELLSTLFFGKKSAPNIF